MPISVPCPSCKASLKVQDNLAGKKIKCPRCSQVVAVPSTKPEAALAAARAPAPSVSAPAAETSTSAATKPAAPSGTVSVPCGCGKKLQVRAELAGKAVKCPGCGKTVRVPGAPAPATPASAPVAPAPAPTAPAEPPAAGDGEEWTEINDAAEAPPPAVAKGGPSGEWGEELMADHGVPDDMMEKIRTQLTKNEKLIWFGRPRVDILMAQARAFRLIGGGVGFGLSVLLLIGSIFLFKLNIAAGCVVVLFAVLFSLLGVFAIGAPARQERNAPKRACYAITPRRVLILPGTGMQGFFSSGRASFVVHTGSQGVTTYNGLELSRMQRVESQKFPGAGSLHFSRSLLDAPSGGGLASIDDVAKVEKLIREKLLHPVVDKVLRGEKLTKEEKGKADEDDAANKTGGQESEDAGPPDDNIKEFGARGDLVPDDPNIKAAPGTGRGGSAGDDPNMKGARSGIEYDPDQLEADVREKVEKELTEGEVVKWVGWPEAGVQGRGLLGAMVGSAKRKEPEYYLYAITNRRVMLWAKGGTKAGGGTVITLGGGGANTYGPVTYYPPHLLQAGLEDDNRIPQGGNIIFKKIKVKIITQHRTKGTIHRGHGRHSNQMIRTPGSVRTSTQVEMHYFGLLRIKRYKAVALLMYETLIKPWVER